MKAQAEGLPFTSMPEDVRIAEMDELYTYIGSKINILLIYIVDQGTRWILDWKLVQDRIRECIQEKEDEVHKVKFYFSEGLENYKQL